MSSPTGRYLHREQFLAEHRAEDTLLIADVLRCARPLTVVELGTSLGGMSAFFSDAVAPWGGAVHTFDIKRTFGPELLEAYPALKFHRANVLVNCAAVAKLIEAPCTLLYCDNGDKEKEIESYAPRLFPGNILGTHDYGTEVRAEFIEPLLAGLGYEPYRHAEFEALAHPTDYPLSLTRFWRRVRTSK